MIGGGKGGTSIARKSILIVEDNATDMKLMRFVLASEGYDISEAQDAEAALAAMARSRPRLVLMDIQLEGTGGLELTRRLKADPQSHGVKVVAVTAYPLEVDASSALAAGCDDYILKPIDTRSFAVAIARHLESA